ncbi:MAG: SDR family NAD(P)-dependent oxidoreductase [Pseudomonadota bacterium]
MRVAVITGAASGIGAGLAREAAKRGMHVVLADCNEASLAAVAAEIGENALAAPTDVSDPASVDALADLAWERFGQVDMLFNNAGVLFTGLSWELPPETWRKTLDVNILGVANGQRSFVPRMVADNRAGRIVNIASIGGFLPSPLMTPYIASKFAIVAMTEGLLTELEMVGAKLSVSLVAPAGVKTEIFKEEPTAASQAFRDQLTAMTAQHGISADELARRIFDAIDRDEYWIFPQPDDFDAPFKARTKMIEQRDKPISPSSRAD